MKNRFIGLCVAATVAATSLLVGGCSDNAVKLVKDGCMNEYPDVTIGNIMALRFADGKWSSETKSGRKIVTFQGKIRPETHALAIRTYGHSFLAALTASIKSVNPNIALTKQYQENLPQTQLAEDEKLFAAAKEKISAIEQQMWDTGLNISPDHDFRESEQSRISLMKNYQKLLASHDYGEGKEFGSRETIEEKIEELKEKEAKYRACEVLAKQWYPIKQQRQALEEKIKVIKDEAIAKTVDKLYWTTGSNVMFQWIVYPDGKNFELASFSNNSWADTGITIQQVFDVINQK